MYAIIETGGKQVKVEVGQAIYVEKLEVAEGESFTFDKVLLVADKDVKVEAKCEKHGRGKKIRIFKYRPKKHSHTKQGHRQAYTKLVVEAINA